MPIYLFRCTSCHGESELLLPLGETDPRTCDACGAETRHRFARVAVKYNGWGFTTTDRLVSDTRGKNFAALSEKATQITET